MLAAFRDTGFELRQIDEPAPDPRAAALFPDAYRSLTTEPRFVFFEAVPR